MRTVCRDLLKRGGAVELGIHVRNASTFIGKTLEKGVEGNKKSFRNSMIFSR